MLEKSRTRAIAGNDSRALLAAMLQRKETVVCQDRRVWVAEHAEEPAFVLRERIGLGLDGVDAFWRDHTQ